MKHKLVALTVLGTFLFSQTLEAQTGSAAYESASTAKDPKWQKILIVTAVAAAVAAGVIIYAHSKKGS